MEHYMTLREQNYENEQCAHKARGYRFCMAIRTTFECPLIAAAPS